MNRFNVFETNFWYLHRAVPLKFLHPKKLKIFCLQCTIGIFCSERTREFFDDCQGIFWSRLSLSGKISVETHTVRKNFCRDSPWKILYIYVYMCILKFWWRLPWKYTCTIVHLYTYVNTICMLYTCTLVHLYTCTLSTNNSTNNSTNTIVPIQLY
jgi:hypothetical protein